MKTYAFLTLFGIFFVSEAFGSVVIDFDDGPGPDIAIDDFYASSGVILMKVVQSF